MNFAHIDSIRPLARSLCSLAAHCGITIDARALSAISGADILTACARLGLPTRRVALPLQAVLPQSLPCVLLLHGTEHMPERCCLLLGLKGEAASILLPENDPAHTEILLADLEKLYLGQAIFPTLDADPEVERGFPQAQGHWLWRMLQHSMPIYRDVMLASIIINLLVLASPLFVMNVYDRVIPNSAMDTLWVLAIGVCFAYFIDFILKNLRTHFVDLAGQNTDVVLSTRIMDKILHSRLESRLDTIGALVNNVREFSRMREFMGSTTLLALVDLPFVLLFIALMAWLGGPLAFLPLCALPLMLLAALVVQAPFRAVAQRQYAQDSQKNAVLVEVISGLETIKANLLQNFMLQRYERIVDANAQSHAKGRGLNALAMNSTALMAGIINTALVVWGAYLIDARQLTMGALIACVILLGRIMASMSQISAIIQQWIYTRSAYKGLNTLMAQPEEDGELALHVPANSTSHGPLAASFTLEEVNFTYPESQQPSLKGVSLHIGPGEKVGIIGATGCGKSTLAKLLLGLYQTQSGRVLYGNVDIRHIHSAQLRSNIGYLAQDIRLFTGTLRDNIIMGCPGISHYRFMQAAMLSGVHDFAGRHPAAYAMPVQEGGQNLSGGQRQAVALARALIRTPSALILDEPSSNLDMAAEQRFIQRSFQALTNTTLILLTHRPSVLALVNRVIVMDQGRIVMDGPRDKVLNALQSMGTEKAKAQTNARPPASEQTYEQGTEAPKQAPEQGVVQNSEALP